LKTEKSATYQFIISTRNRKKEENIIKTNTFKTGESSFFNFSGKICKRSIELDDIDRHKKDSVKWDTTNQMEFESFLKMKSSFLSKSQIVLKIELVQVNMLSTTSKGVIEISLDPFENAYSIKGDVHLSRKGTKYNILYLLRIRKGLVNNDYEQRIIEYEHLDNFPNKFLDDEGNIIYTKILDSYNNTITKVNTNVDNNQILTQSNEKSRSKNSSNKKSKTKSKITNSNNKDTVKKKKKLTYDEVLAEFKTILPDTELITNLFHPSCV